MAELKIVTLKYIEEDEAFITDLSEEDTDTEEGRIQEEYDAWDSDDQQAYEEYVDFHADYQKQYGQHGSLRNIIWRQMNRMVEAMPNDVPVEEMKTADLTNQVVIEKVEGPDGAEVKRIRPVFIKSDPDKEDYTHKEKDKEPFPWFDDDQRLPKLPKDQVIGYWEDELEAEKIRCAEPPLSEDELEDMEAEVTEVDTVQIEQDFNSIAGGLRQAAQSYSNLASTVRDMQPYQAAEVVQQTPAPPTSIPAPLAAAIQQDGAEAVVDKLIAYDHTEGGLSYSKLQAKYGVSRHRVQQVITGRKRKGGSQYGPDKKKQRTDQPGTSAQE